MAVATYTEVYVDPSSGSNSNGGTSDVDAYLTTQYALDNTTKNTTNPVRINVKDSANDVLTATLDFSTYAPGYNTGTVTIQGYTSVAGDGGLGVIDGNATYSVFNAGGTGICFVDMRLTNSGSADIVAALGQFNGLYGCEIDNSTADGVTMSGKGAAVLGCNIHNIGGFGVTITSAAEAKVVIGNYFKNGTNDFTAAINAANADTVILDNIISIDGASDGIRITDYQSVCAGNTVLSASGTGSGILISGATVGIQLQVYNNYVEGFVGSGGIGYEWVTNSQQPAGLYGSNAAYNNATNYSEQAKTQAIAESNQSSHPWIGANETLSGTGLDKSGADSFANRFVYFKPISSGTMLTGGFPELAA